jgi:hypothetical protein
MSSIVNDGLQNSPIGCARKLKLAFFRVFSKSGHASSVVKDLISTLQLIVGNFSVSRSLPHAEKTSRSVRDKATAVWSNSENGLDRKRSVHRHSRLIASPVGRNKALGFAEYQMTRSVLQSRQLQEYVHLSGRIWQSERPHQKWHRGAQINGPATSPRLQKRPRGPRCPGRTGIAGASRRSTIQRFLTW